MATITKGYTFGATEEVTATKLHSLVDDGTVTSIVAANITSGTITDTQMSSVGGAKFVTLTAVPAGAGKIPAANLTLTGLATSGANSDITSITGLTTALTVAQGGTGSTAAKNTAGGVVIPTGAVNAASGVVVLDGTSKLPAVDGSLLTGLSAVPSGCILLWSGSTGTIPTGYVICDGTNSTPDLRNRFVMAAGDTYAVGATGDGTIPAHTHSVQIAGTGGGAQMAAANYGLYNPVYSTSSSYGTGTQNIAVYYALAYIMKT